MLNRLWTLTTLLLWLAGGSGCAAITTRGGLPKFERLHPTNPVNISYRALVMLRQERGHEVSYTFRSDPAFRRTVEKALKGSGDFAEIRFRSLLKPAPPVTTEELKDLEQHLDPLSSPAAPGALTVSWYQIEELGGTGGWEMLPFGLYGLVHVGTVGIIPFFWPNSRQVLIRVTDSTGKLVASEERRLTAWSISWLPFYFRQDLKELQAPDFWDELHENQNKVLIGELMAGKIH